MVIHLLVTRAEHFRTRLLNFLLSKFLLPRPRPKRVFVEVEPSERNGTLQFWQERHKFSPCVDEKPAGRWFPATALWLREETDSGKGRQEPAAKRAKTAKQEAAAIPAVPAVARKPAGNARVEQVVKVLRDRESHPVR